MISQLSRWERTRALYIWLTALKGKDFERCLINPIFLLAFIIFSLRCLAKERHESRMRHESRLRPKCSQKKDTSQG